jgi:hypothetical protein
MRRSDALTVNLQLLRHRQTLGACSRHTSACTYSSAPANPPSTFFRHVANPSDVNLPLTQTQPHGEKIRTPDTHKPRATLFCAVAPHIFESWVRN